MGVPTFYWRQKYGEKLPGDIRSVTRLSTVSQSSCKCGQHEEFDMTGVKQGCIISISILPGNRLDYDRREQTYASIGHMDIHIVIRRPGFCR